MTGGRPFNLLAALLALLGAAFVLAPLAGLVIRAPWERAWTELLSPEALEALRLSLLTSVAATVVAMLLGLPLAWVQARYSFPGRNLLRGLTVLPLVMPPVVGGAALLFAFDRQGLLGQPLAQRLGIQLPFTTAGVVVAQAFISMPFLVLAVEAGLRSIDRRFEDLARTLGASRWEAFRKVTLPLIGPSVAAGAVLAWSRALGEFGATITFAGSMPGVSRTVPLAIYVLRTTRPGAATMLSLLLVAVSLAVLVRFRDRWLRVAG
jgi:molybdate transport system permease protein